MVVTEHRSPSWLDALRKVGGIPAEATLTVMRDYAEMSMVEAMGMPVLSRWTGGYIADWYLADRVEGEAMVVTAEQEVLVDNVAVLVRKWEMRG